MFISLYFPVYLLFFTKIEEMISVCLSSYNGEKYIKEQVMSILNQLSLDDELIISDDGSSDSTLSILYGINDRRIKVFTNPLRSSKHKYSQAHYQVTKNFENSLSVACGDYIFLADQDDVWEPDKVLITVEYLRTHKLVVSNHSIIDSYGNLIQTSHCSKNPISPNFWRNVIRMPFYGCCMAFRRELLQEILPFPKELIMHDNWIGLYASWKKYDIYYVEKPLIKYRRHQSNVSPSTRQNANPLWFKIWYRIVIVIEVLCRHINSKLIW